VVADGFRVDSETGELLEVLDASKVPDDSKPTRQVLNKVLLTRNLRPLTWREKLECPWWEPEPDSVDQLPKKWYRIRRYKRVKHVIY